MMRNHFRSRCAFGFWCQYIIMMLTFICLFQFIEMIHFCVGCWTFCSWEERIRFRFWMN